MQRLAAPDPFLEPEDFLVRELLDDARRRDGDLPPLDGVSDNLVREEPQAAADVLVRDVDPRRQRRRAQALGVNQLLVGARLIERAQRLPLEVL